MTAMTVLVLVASVAAASAAAARWLRVAQREHYLPGSCRTTAVRWAMTRPPNAFLVVVGSLAAVLALVGDLTDQRAVAVASALVAAAAVLLFPWGMSLVGRPRVAFTRRARTLAAVFLVLLVGLWLLLAVVVGAVASSGIVVVVVPLMVDLALVVTTPLERQLLERHRKTAEKKLNVVAPFVIAVTGSWGKTSTKNHIRDLLADSCSVVASPASWNNTAGLSRTINEHLASGTEVLVAEMGTYGPGEIRAMCAWVPPRVAIICAVGPMHLERAGSLEAIAAAKAEILERAETAVLWVDDPVVSDIAAHVPCPKVMRVGTRGTADLDVSVEVAEDSGDISVMVGEEIVGVCAASSGVHPGNLGCAVAAAVAYGVDVRHLARRIPLLRSPDHRATAALNDAGVLVIDDTFNSNPSGARAGIETLERDVDGRRAVVTPGMVELGPLQRAENEALAQSAVASGATLVAVGWTNRRALVEGSGGSAIVVPDRNAARRWVRENLRAGDGVLWENDLPDHYP